MRSIQRREEIMKLLKASNSAIKGMELANRFDVTRQIIVKDIAILRAAGNSIIATPDGYIYNVSNNKVKSIVAVNHNTNETINELETVVKYGGIIEDVIIEHPLYGEIRGNLMIKNLNDLNKFEHEFINKNIKPLSNLTNGVHLHTISTDTEDDMKSIKMELKEKGFLL
ncbi:transcription repressor NadR [Clostridium chauvoei]|uniref:Transcription repressor NadR n=2 Tax=Clostridium chauvoei TaxID=46867 RepID=A0ABD4RK17_9CLOT|nr:transcription repressor NadR [Clostridium chauvoei]ATD53757.1 transcription repressor NadR [Clostridium chauvoei]ATD56278.1 transcription repressor NadR [Clostridium chauvoei]MBX7281449.1 transcription repressor NadR [Clostridium chauvoei]MBX7283993.1 transcription repressor NadR [Clostridium chauvoei]MBX7286497.1 transcription repressor NadR [Clostridium chauvoei]